MEALAWIAGAVASAFIGILLTVLFQEPITDALAWAVRPLASVVRGRDISGTWFTYWSIVPESGSSKTAARPSEEIAVIRLRRIGNRVIGSDASKKRNYVISATLRDDKFLTGVWHDFSNGRYQWGGFQLCWDDDNGAVMVGKFVGKDSHNHVNHGLWLWSRQEKKLPALADWAADVGYEFDHTAFKDAIKIALPAAPPPCERRRRTMRALRHDEKASSGVRVALPDR